MRATPSGVAYRCALPAATAPPGGCPLLIGSDMDGSHAGARLAHETGSGRYPGKLWNDE